MVSSVKPEDEAATLVQSSPTSRHCVMACFTLVGSSASLGLSVSLILDETYPEWTRRLSSTRPKTLIDPHTLLSSP